MSFIRWLDSYDPAERARLGGKNASLGELLAAGLPVPPGFAVTVDAYHTVRGHPEVRQAVIGLLEEVDLGDPAALEELSAAIRRRIEEVPLDDGVAAAVRAAYQRLCERCELDAVPVAVRSSATSEDLPDASFAGEHDTYLWVRGPDDVLRHLARCWSSLFTARAIAYRRGRGYDHDVVAMSVAVQKMVLPTASGSPSPSTPATATAPRSRSRPPGGSARASSRAKSPRTAFWSTRSLARSSSGPSPTRRSSTGWATATGSSGCRSTKTAGPPPASPTTRSRRWPAWPGGPSGTTAAPRTWSGRWTATCPRTRP